MSHTRETLAGMLDGTLARLQRVLTDLSEEDAIPAAYPGLFDTGTGGEADYPAVGSITPFATDVNTQMRRLALEGDLDRPLEGSRAYASVGAALLFLLYHRGYHIGKIATLRALLGKQRVFG